MSEISVRYGNVADCISAVNSCIYHTTLWRPHISQIFLVHIFDPELKLKATPPKKTTLLINFLTTEWHRINPLFTPSCNKRMGSVVVVNFWHHKGLYVSVVILTTSLKSIDGMETRVTVQKHILINCSAAVYLLHVHKINTAWGCLRLRLCANN